MLIDKRGWSVSYRSLQKQRRGRMLFAGTDGIRSVEIAAQSPPSQTGGTRCINKSYSYYFLNTLKRFSHVCKWQYMSSQYNFLIFILKFMFIQANIDPYSISKILLHSCTALRCNEIFQFNVFIHLYYLTIVFIL